MGGGDDVDADGNTYKDTRTYRHMMYMHRTRMHYTHLITYACTKTHTNTNHLSTYTYIKHAHMHLNTHINTHIYVNIHSNTHTST